MNKRGNKGRSEKEIINFIRKSRVITSSELANHLGVSWNTAEKYLLEEVIEKKVVKLKKLGVNLWMLK
jgi:DeoR/GlpR family transcriptional regulator of sugar metabolism